MTQVERITRMETHLNQAEAAIRALNQALDEFAAAQDDIRALSGYYGSEEWNRDFDDDREGKLPPDLRRGVLSEDGIYNLLIDNRNAVNRMLEVTAEYVRSGRL